MTLEEAYKAMRAIAEGYPCHGVSDRYVVVENPEYSKGSDKDPNLVVDVKVLKQRYVDQNRNNFRYEPGNLFVSPDEEEDHD